MAKGIHLTLENYIEPRHISDWLDQLHALQIIEGKQYTCDYCQQSDDTKPLLFFDSSDGEYTTVTICMTCVIKSFQMYHLKRVHERSLPNFNYREESKNEQE